MKLRLSLTCMIVAAELWSASPAPSHAQIPVIDPANLAQSIIQASQGLEQINNQIRQIDQQASMLAQNPLQLSPELSQSIGQARQLFSAAQGLTFQVNLMSNQLKALYPDTWDNFNLADVGQRTQQWLQEDRAATERSLNAQNQALQSIAATQGHVDRALLSSSQAQGPTGVGQATNQLLGINANQLAEIHALLIAQSRALDTERMDRIAREERALEIQRRAFPSQSNATLTPARSAFEQ